jgi:flagellar FliL protein
MSAKAATATVVDGAPAEGGGKKKKMIIIIVAALVVVLAAGGGAAFFLMGGKKKGKGAKAKHSEEVSEAQDEGGDGEHGEEAADEHAEEEEHEDEGKKKPPVYATLEPFVVNIASEAADRYLQVGIDVKVSGPEIADKIKLHLPEIRNGILLILSSKKVEELNSVEGKNRLRVEIRDAVNKPLGMYKRPPQGMEMKSVPKKGAMDVLLTSFVIQ